MTDFARLGIAVDSRAAKTASTDLGHLAREGRKASESADALTRSTNRTRDAHGRYVGQARKATQATGRFGDSAKVASSTVSAMGKAIGALAVGMAGIASAQQAVIQARGFQAALAETSTLISGTRAEMSLVEQEARRMAGTFGGTATNQVKAFYQAISAGADGVEAAAEILDQSNRLAIGGVTDVTTGVDALTTAMNAFSATGLTAAEASDAMFVGMKAGKTTIGELSAQMGQIVPIASAAGVSFDEMIAGISALTTQGQSTAMATTGLRAAITGILQPSKQAADAAKLLGLEFSASALQAKGLEQFMAEVVQTTGGSTDALTQLFGSVEALNAVLALSGAAGQTFTGIMGDMANKAGATDTAYQKLTEGLDQRLIEVLGRLSNIVLSVGNGILTVAVPAMEVFASGIEFVAQHSDALVTIMAGLAASAIPNMIASLGTLTGIMATTTAAATGLATAMWAATGPWGILAGLVAAAGAAYVVFGRETKTFQDTMTELDAAQDTLNTQVAAFATTYAPAAGGAAIEAANDYLQLAKAAREAAAAQLAADTTEMARIRGMIDNGHLRNLTIAEEAKLSARLHGATSRLTVSQTAYDQALRARDETVHTVMSSDGEMVKAAKTLNSEIEITVDGLGGLGRAGGKAAKGLDRVKSQAEAYADALKEAAYTTEDFGTEKANILISGIDGVSGAWGDFVSRGFSDFKGFAKNILDSFKGMLAQMITMAAKNRIMIGLGISGVSAGPAVASGSSSLGGGLLGQLGGHLLGSAGGLLSGVGSFTSGVASGIGGVFSGGGLSSSLSSLGGMVTGSVGITGGAIGAAIPVLGAVAAAISFFKTKTKHLDNGLRVTADNVGILVEEFDKVQKSKFWGLSKKVSLTFSEADEATAAPIRKAIGDITGSILTASEQLGLSADNFSSWSTQIQVSLKGLDEAARNAEIQRIFDTVAEQFSYAALGSFNDVMGGALIREGETATDTLNALVVSLQAANNGLGLVNAALFDTSVVGANMARSLTDAFGGVDNFNAAVNGYFTAFYTQEEQLAARTGRLADQFDALNATMPATRDGLRSLIEAQDLNTAGGRDLYAGLVLLSGEFAELSSLSEQLYGSAVLASGGVAQLVRSLASGVVGSENELASAQQAAMAEYNNVLRIMDIQIGAARTARDSIKSIFDILSDGLDSRSLLDQEAEKLRRQNLQTELASGISDPQRLRKVIQGLNEPSEQFFGSYVDYAQDYARTSALMSQQKGVAEDQLTEAEKQLLALRDQKTAIQNLYGPLLGIDSNTDNLEEALERLDLTMKSVEAATSRMEDAMYALANAMLAAISGIGGTGGLMGMGADAFSAFSLDRTNGIFSEDAAGSLDGIAGQINGIYQDVFGRNADVAGLEFYGNLLQGGDIKAGRVAYDLMTSGEANTGVTPGFGNIGSAAQPVDPVEALYGSMLGRPADAAGVEFWKSTGLEGDALVNAFRDASLAAGEAPSFDGGGYTGNGSRTGGVDGLGGFWSLLHPQETVIDHTRGGPFGFGGVGAPPAPAGGYRLPSSGRSDGSSAQLAQVVAELRRANDRLARLEKQNKESATYAKRSSEVLERVDALGVETRPAT